MIAKVFSGAVIGLESTLIEVEVDVSPAGMPSFTIVGLPDKAIEESKERVRTALKNSECDFPPHKITVNLAPAELQKEGAGYDLAIAVGVLLATGQMASKIEDTLVVGELALDGKLRRINGVLSLAFLAKEKGFKKMFLPKDNALEAAIVPGLEVIPVVSLRDLALHLRGVLPIIPQPQSETTILGEEIEYEIDFMEIKGQEQAKRALEIAAAGGHNLLLKGPPGAGKTMMARALPSILPDLSFEEAVETTKIYSVTGMLAQDQGLVRHRPFRNPHHTASVIGIVGGGSHPKPGEISLAHRGVLFLDEFPEFPRQILEALRQPLEDGVVTISRAQGSMNFPAKFILIAAANPCPCGFLGDRTKQCRCTLAQISKYQKRLSGPILDRIDLHVEVPAVETEKITNLQGKSEESKTIRQRVQRAREKQRQRFAGRKLTCNAEMSAKEVREFCNLSDEVLQILKQAMNSMGLSARGCHRLIKVARTIADLSESEAILTGHLAEALQFRQKQENLLY